MRQKSMSIIASTSTKKKKKKSCGCVLTPERENVTAQTRCPLENHVPAIVVCTRVTGKYAPTTAAATEWPVVANTDVHSLSSPEIKVSD